MVTYIQRHAEIYGTFAKDSNGKPYPAAGSPGDDWLPATIEHEDWGRFRIVINGVDLSFWRGTRSVIEEFSSTDPFGDATATVWLPQVTQFDLVDKNAAGTLYGPAPRGSTVEIQRVHPDETTTTTMWSGHVVGYSDRDEGIGVECVGAFYDLDRFIKYPDFHTVDLLGTRDTGEHIVGYVNFLILSYGLNLNLMDPTITGIVQRNPGAFEPVVTGWMTELLSKAETGSLPGVDPKSWTINCRARQPVLRFRKKFENVYQYQAGSRGVNPRLGADYLEAPTAIFAEGVGDDNGVWRNTKYPRQRIETPPVYAGPPGGYTAGDSGTQVDLIKTELKATGYGSGLSAVGSPFVASDFIDGPIGWFKVASGNVLTFNPGVSWEAFNATDWANLFQTTGDIGYPVFLPIYEDERTHPHLHDARGNVIGLNPEYTPPGTAGYLPRVEAFRDYGKSNKFAATIQARREIEYTAALNHTGTIECQTDPQQYEAVQGGGAGAQKSRFDIRAGHNIQLLNYRNAATRELFVAKAVHRPEDLRSTFTVDERDRDFMTLQAIHERNLQAREDPAARIRRSLATSRLREDRYPAWDSEAGSGVIERTAVEFGNFTIIKFPAARFGQIQAIELKMTDANGAPYETTFVAALWGREVTSDQIKVAIGYTFNPDLAEGSSSFWGGINPQRPDGSDTALIWAGGRGGATGSLGWWPNDPGDHNDPADQPNITGVHEDRGGWEFVSDQPPWLWLSVMSLAACHIEGRLFLAETQRT